MMYGYSRSSRAPATRPGRPILASPGVPSRITFASIRAIISKAARGLSFAIHSKTRSSSLLRQGRTLPSCTGRTKAPEDFFGRNRSWIWIGDPTLYFRYLFIGQPETALVLPFHFAHHTRPLFLSLP